MVGFNSGNRILKNYTEIHTAIHDSRLVQRYRQIFKELQENKAYFEEQFLGHGADHDDHQKTIAMAQARPTFWFSWARRFMLTK